MRALAADPPIHLLVIAKAPVAGRVKTRLCPPYTMDEAARLAAAALVDTLEAVLATPADARTIVLDGDPGPWLPAGFAVIPQRGHGLDARLACAFDDAQREHAGAMLLIGMDTPQVTPALLASSCSTLQAIGTDAVLGPTADGGWWALGLHRADPGLLLGVPMSTSHTGVDQLARLNAAGLSVAMLPELVDVDDAVAASLVGGQAPTTRFAVALATMAMAS